MSEILVIALIVLLIFGGRKIPELMRSMGKGVKNFKDEMNGDGADAAGAEEKDVKKTESSDKDSEK